MYISLYTFSVYKFIDGKMPIITVRVDEETKRMMDRLRHINWSEVIRRAIRKKIREEMRRNIDRRRLLEAYKLTEKLRRECPGWDSVREIRRWRGQI